MKVNRYRDAMAGGLMYDMAEKMIMRTYGENEFTMALVEVLPDLEDIRYDHQQRSKKKPKNKV